MTRTGLMPVTLPVTIAALVLLSACSSEHEPAPKTEPGFNIDMSRVSTSGVSAGGYMAGQLHVAHSSVFNGVGIIAAGPYYCARGSMQTGLGACMNGGDVGLDALSAYLREQAAADRVDAPDNMAADAVWIFIGSDDDIISTDVTEAAKSFYAQFVPEQNIAYVDSIGAPHGMPTLESGVACDAVETPFLNACGYDAAGELLAAIAGPLAPRAAASGELRRIPQPGGEDADMLESALLYVPASCAGGEACGIHVALHGCQQSTEFVGDAFAVGAGYNEWAEGNRLLVLYPQVASSKLAPLNPLGCWDWWGYTGDDYATQSGAQISSIMQTIESLRGHAE